MCHLQLADSWQKDGASWQQNIISYMPNSLICDLLTSCDVIQCYVKAAGAIAIFVVYVAHTVFYKLVHIILYI